MTSSPIIRGALTAVSWLLRSPVPYAAFVTPREALSWLREQHASVDAASVEAAIAAAVPGFATRSWPRTDGL